MCIVCMEESLWSGLFARHFLRANILVTELDSEEEKLLDEIK